MTGSQAAYARHRKELGLIGGSGASVVYALREGRIAYSDADKKLIDFEQADIDWAKNTSPAAQAVGQRGGQGRAEQIQKKGPARKPFPVPPTAAAPVPSIDEPPIPNKGDYNQSRAAKEYYEAELSRLKFEEKEGKLIPVETVKRVMYAAGRIVRAGHDEIVAQLAPDCASETNIEAVERILKKALDDLDNRLADKIAKLDQELSGIEEPLNETE